MLTEKKVRHFLENTLDGESTSLKLIREKIEALGLEHEEVFPSQIAFFKTLCLGAGVQEILELGTFLGYSTAGFAEFLKDTGSNGHIITVELDEKRAIEATRSLEAIGLDKYVTFLVGDASTVCQELSTKKKKFDLVFLDVFEECYPGLYHLCVELLKPQGLLIIDNVLMPTVDGWVSGRNVIEPNDDKLLNSLRELIDLAASDPKVSSSILPLGSGLLICSKLMK
jgi:predicted O-methyltransferase YrrM